MKIRLESDIHLEFEDTYKPKGLEDIDVLCLAGDIHVGTRAVKYLESWLEEYPKLRIVYVLGNHEFYRENLDKLPNEIREKITHERLHFLDNESVVIEGIRFIGSTLWTDFDRLNPSQVHKCWSGMNDFKLIRHTSQYHKISPYILEARHHKCRNYIFEELEKSEEPTVVLTHHKPYVLQHNISDENLWSAFQVDLDSKLDNCEKLPKLWLSGHTHMCEDINFGYHKGEVRFVSNCVGYPHERPLVGYKDNLVIEI